MANVRVILCMDYDPTGVTVRRILLSRDGYTLLATNSVYMALNLVSANQVDLVIADDMLRDGTGAELISEVKRLKPQVQVLLFIETAKLPHASKQADLCITKCMMPAEFLATIEMLLSNSPGAAKESGERETPTVNSPSGERL